MATLYSSGASTPDATESTAGKLRVSTNAEATAGTNDTTAMTPAKVAAAINANPITGALVYRGSYDASTQSPDITGASKGDFYLVSVAGALDGVALSVGDHVVFNQDAADPVTSAMFDKIDSTDAVASVNGQTGVVNLTAANVNALASGDNVSALTNDAGYLTSAPVTSVNTLTGAVNLTAAEVGALATGDNVSALTNDAGYLTSAPVTSVNTQTGAVTLTASDVGALASGDNISELTNDSGYLTSTLSADIIVDTDGAYDLGTESARLGLTFSDLDGAVTFKASNASGAQITKGQPVYIAGVSGDVPTVALADADAAAMPCAGLAAETANSGAAVRIVSFGNLTSVDTSSFSLGDTLYIDTTAGALTATPPAGESAKLQNIGKVIRVHATSGVIKVGGAGRSAATPNLDQNKIFLGDSNNRAVSTALSAVALSSFNNDLGLATVATSGAYSDLSGTPTLGTAAASDSGDFLASTATIGNLSDVSISSVSNGQVLSYNSTSGDWENSTPSSGGATDLDGLSDVTITSVSGGDLLQNNGSGQFVNVAKSSINISTFNDDGTYQAADAGLTSISGLTTAADKMIYTTGSDTYAVTGLTSAGRALLDDADAAAQRTTLGLGTAATSASGDFQPVDAGLTSISGLTTAADKMIYTTGSDTYAVADLTSAGRALLDDADAAAQRTTLGLGSAALLAADNTADNVVKLDSNGKLPAIDGSQLTNLPTASAASETAAGIIEIATSAEAAAGTDDLKAMTPLTVKERIDASVPNITPASPGAAYDITTHDGIEEIYLLTPSANIAVNIPAASASGAGFKYNIKNLSGTYSLTLTPASGTIDGESTHVIDVEFESITLLSDGNNYHII